MKGYTRFLLGVVLSLIFISMFTSTTFAETDELTAIQTAIKGKVAFWTAGESWVTRLSPEERKNLLGEKTLELGIAETVTPPPTTGYPAGYPAAIDWRNKDGHNWITPIRDQQSCGSCVAFGSVATLESLVLIEQNQPDTNFDLSEMHLFNCGGGSCSYGWYNSSACSYLKTYGTPDEACWPYQPVNRSCSQTCPDWQSRAVKITSYGAISGIEACKTYTAIAPILVAFDVYDDFFYYTGGIYQHVWGNLAGGHAVSIVGYDTTGPVPYWIVKNSWGSAWGESGFFRIKMGECGIETRSSYWMSGAILPIVPDISVTLTPDAISIPRGGTLGYTVTVTNNTTSSQTFQYWTYVTLPNGNRYPPTGELFGPKTVTLSAGQTRSAHLTHGIPNNAPLGTYTYYGDIGSYPTVWNSDSFQFTVTATVAPGAKERQGWELLENGFQK